MTRSDKQRISDILKAIQSIHRSKALLEKHSEDEIEETVLAAVTAPAAKTLP